MDIMTIIQNRLKCDGFAQCVMGRLTESERHLIAAAPDMDAALEAVQLWYACDAHGWHGTHADRLKTIIGDELTLSALLDFVGAAQAKARGEQP